MKLYSSRKLYIYSDKCWTGSTKVYRQDEVDEQMVSYEFHAEAIANKDAEIAAQSRITDAMSLRIGELEVELLATIEK